MKYEEWLQLFPNSKIIHHIPKDARDYVIPLEENTYLQIPYEQLTNRELALLETKRFSEMSSRVFLVFQSIIRLFEKRMLRRFRFRSCKQFMQRLKKILQFQ